MASSEAFLCENDLDEEKAKRSIIVSNVPENITHKDVIIHFQRKSNGGGEVDQDMFANLSNRPPFVITFEDPSIVETAINQPQFIGERKVTVRQYETRPLEIGTPEIFSSVDARINLDLFRDSVPALKEVLILLGRDFGITRYKSTYGYVISGSYQQITSCHKYILEEMPYIKGKQQRQSRSANDAGTSESHDDSDVTPGSRGPSDDFEVITPKVFQTIPIVLEFIFTVPKYEKKIQGIQSDFAVKIRGIEGGSKVEIIPLRGCTTTRHEDAGEEFINVYRDVYDGSMMSKVVELRPGASTIYTAEEAINEIMQKTPVVIQRMDVRDKWMFYGEETNVKYAIRQVCMKLDIDPPTGTRKVRLRVVKGEEEETGAAYSHAISRQCEVGEDAMHENPSIMKDPIAKDFPADKELPFEIKTKKGFQMTVHQGDITKEVVDVIVNSTDEYLSFLNGLPAAIVESGGSIIKEEVQSYTKRRKAKPGDIVITKAGRLNCSKIIHILTKYYSKHTNKKGQEDCKKAVKDGCLECLRSAQKEKLRSIAFPAVGSGLQGMPLNICAQAMITAVEEYMRQSDTKYGAVTDIRFVHLDAQAVEAFKAELKRRYGDSIVKSPERDDIARTKHSRSTLPPLDKSSGFHDDKKTAKKEDEDVCPICLDGFHDPRSLSKCNHKFCKSCIDEAFKRKKVCPTCGMTYGVQTGNMPQGTMRRYSDYTRLPGYEWCGTIRIDYSFPSGTQGPEHPNPGRRYSGTSRTAYLPDNHEGREVLGLLKKAFDARLTFTIGTSVTTGMSDTVTWNDIHHKTNPSGGATGFGYPDPTYLKRVKAELAAKGIS